MVKLDHSKIDYGLTYIVQSRVSKMQYIRLKDGISMNRLYNEIGHQSKMEGRIKEKNQLKLLCTLTLEYFN